MYCALSYFILFFCICSTKNATFSCFVIALVCLLICQSMFRLLIHRTMCMQVLHNQFKVSPTTARFSEIKFVESNTQLPLHEWNNTMSTMAIYVWYIHGVVIIRLYSFKI